MEQLESSSIQYQLNSEQNVDTDEPPPHQRSKKQNFLKINSVQRYLKLSGITGNLILMKQLKIIK